MKGTRLIAGIVIAIHLVMSLALIALILLHSGKGGGLSDAFGGGAGPLGDLGGSTMAERNLNRLTVAVAVMFAITTFALAWVLE
jgi:preprotein translocase subunit SecG